MRQPRRRERRWLASVRSSSSIVFSRAYSPSSGDRVIVKGGVVLEFRLARARTTRDVDLRLVGSPDNLLGHLQAAGRRDLGDYLTFGIEIDREHPTIEGEGVVYEGRRYRAEGKLAGKPYGVPFGVDVAFGDVLSSAPDIVEGSRFLEFAGLPPTSLRLYPREAHIAEKVHAYTLPRRHENSRVKDLPDLALLGQTGAFDASTLRAAIGRTFEFRKCQAVPSALPSPPASWTAVYARMAESDALPWPTLDAVLMAARAFLDPVLQGSGGTWSTEAWQWK